MESKIHGLRSDRVNKPPIVRIAEFLETRGSEYPDFKLAQDRPWRELPSPCILYPVDSTNIKVTVFCPLCSNTDETRYGSYESLDDSIAFVQLKSGIIVPKSMLVRHVTMLILTHWEFRQEVKSDGTEELDLWFGLCGRCETWWWMKNENISAYDGE